MPEKNYYLTAKKTDILWPYVITVKILLSKLDSATLTMSSPLKPLKLHYFNNLLSQLKLHYSSSLLSQLKLHYSSCLLSQLKHQTSKTNCKTVMLTVSRLLFPLSRIKNNYYICNSLNIFLEQIVMQSYASVLYYVEHF